MSVLQAVTWKNKTTKSCCHSRGVVLAPLDDPPQQFKQLFENLSFLVKIRSPSSILALTSMGASRTENIQIDEQLANTQECMYFIFQQTLQMVLYFGDTWFISPLFAVACLGHWAKPLF